MGKRTALGLVFSCSLLAGGCAPSEPPEPPPGPAEPADTTPAPAPVEPQPTAPVPTASATITQRAPLFADDVAFLKTHGEVIELATPSGGRVAVSPTYQGRVMTSAVSEGGPSLGFLNRSFIRSKETGTQFDNYGGEDRFWLGPEAGQFGLYFPQGKPFEFAHWQTPAALQEGSWSVAKRSDQAVTFTRSMEIQNYSGASLNVGVKRTVRTLGEADVARLFGKKAPPLTDLDWVAFETVNEITNTGKNAWTKQTGAPSVWILSMFNASADGWVIVPYEKNAKGPIVNDAYFGRIPADRLRVREDDGVVLLRCDGDYRSKIGIGPLRAKPFAGSYSAASRLLTLVHYSAPAGATDYVNSMWGMQEEPFRGDAVNSYNHGPTEPGKPAAVHFYELETSSPAAFLRPGKSLTHVQRTLHFVGEPAQLNAVAQAALGVPLSVTRQ